MITLVAGMLVLHELGLSIAPLLAAAGVAGIAIGFGAQSLVKDYFTGVIMLLEDQARVGDVVEIAEARGHRTDCGGSKREGSPARRRGKLRHVRHPRTRGTPARTGS